MTIGTVKFFNEQKGYGFIQPDDGGQDAFVHISAVERAGFRSLRQDQRVSYDLEENRGKTSAVNLKEADAKAEEAKSEQAAPTGEANEASDASQDSAQQPSD